MLICTSCGNKKQFTEDIRYKEFVTETSIIDGETEEEIDARDRVVNDSEIYDQGGIVCDNCGGEGDCIESFPEKNKDYWITIWEHTDKDGIWHGKILPEKKRDENIMLEAGVELL